MAYYGGRKQKKEESISFLPSIERYEAWLADMLSRALLPYI
jgi:hypothetical protein